MKNIYLFVIIFLLKFSVNAQPGSLDNSFGTGGKVITDFSSNYEQSRSLAIQSNGKIVVAGYSYNGYYDFALARYNNDGSLDNAFGYTGKVLTDFGSLDDIGSSVAIQSDGKIVLAGYTHNGFDYDFALARYNNDGSLDNTFGYAGKVLTDFGNLDDFGFSVTIQNDGKIVVAGCSYTLSNIDFALARYNNDGTLDSTFGSFGKVLTNFGGSNDRAYSAIIQNDGKIVLAGESYNSSYHYFALVRYNSDGTLDNSFSFDGKTLTNVGGFQDSGMSVAIQSDGKIVATGQSYTGSNIDFALVRYNSDGSLDNTFDLDGKIITDLGGHDLGRSIIIQSDGKIVVVGISCNGSNYDFALARYNSNGTLDNSFDSDGKVITDFGTTRDVGWSVAIQNDGKIVVAGVSGDYPNGDFAIVRYNGDASVNIEANTETSDINIYPNPSSGIFTVNLKNKTAETKICVYDVLGNCVLDKISAKNSSQEIDLSRQAKGIYFMEIISEGERDVQKIVLQ